MKLPLAPAFVLLLAASSPAGPGREDDGWVTIKNETETVEFRVPPLFKELDPGGPYRLKLLQYEPVPYSAAVIQCFGFADQTKLDLFMDFVQRNVLLKTIGGSFTYEEGSDVRFLAEYEVTGSFKWVSLVEGRIKGKYGYYLECRVRKEVFEKDRTVWDKVIQSFQAFDVAPETYTVPPTWKTVKNEWYAVLGPVSEIKEPKARDHLERQLNRVATWLDPTTSASLNMFRDMTGDVRKYPRKSVIHVLPNLEAFRAEAGDWYEEGAAVLYLPDSKDRNLVVNGAPDAGLKESDVVAEAGVQYMETRLGKMPPWLRSGYWSYIEYGFRSRCTAGVFPPEAMVRAKAVFGKSPPPFEELTKKDAVALGALGEDGFTACWGYLQYGLNGPDVPVRNMFRKWIRDAVASQDLAKAWDGAVASYKDEAKKPFKFRDVDSGAKKYFKDWKEEKEKK